LTTITQSCIIVNMENRIRTLRAKNGWSRNRLAGLLSTTERTIYRWEVGQNYPTPVHQKALERLFKKNGV